MEPDRRITTLGWGDVSYLEWRPEGPSARSTVLLLHGGGLDSASLSWGEVGAALADAGHRVIAPDHPGYGESPAAPWTHTLERLVSYVGELVEALQLRRYAIGGLSLGGGMSIGHALRRPPGVTGVLLLGSYGLMDHQFDRWWARPAHLLTWAILRSGALGAVTRAYGRDRRLMATTVRSLIRNPDQRTPELLDAIMSAAGRGEGLSAFEQFQRAEFGPNGLRTNYLAQLSTLAHPVLLVHGDQDTGVPVARAQEAARRLPQGRLVVVPDAGHWVQRDRPDLVLPPVLQFLDQLG